MIPLKVGLVTYATQFGDGGMVGSCRICLLDRVKVTSENIQSLSNSRSSRLPELRQTQAADSELIQTCETREG